MNEQQLYDIIEKIKQNERKNERILWMTRIAQNFQEEERKRKQENFMWFGVFSLIFGSGFYFLFRK